MRLLFRILKISEKNQNQPIGSILNGFTRKFKKGNLTRSFPPTSLRSTAKAVRGVGQGICRARGCPPASTRSWQMTGMELSAKAGNVEDLLPWRDMYRLEM